MKYLTLRPWWLPLAVAFTPVIGRAQSTGILLRAGDALSTGELVLAIRDARIGDDGSWLALVETDLADATQNMCLLRDGVIVLREGSPVSVPAGTLEEWDELASSPLGDLGMILRVRPDTTLIQVDGAYWNDVKVVIKDDVIQSPHLGAGTEWDAMHVVKLNSSNTMFLMGEVMNPALTRSRERALVRYQLDSAGNILDTTVLATEGMTVPAGITLAGALCLGNNEHVLSVNDRGDFLTLISNDAIPVKALVINMQQVVAQTGQASPVGEPWRELSLSRVALNDLGEYAISGAVGSPTTADSYLIVKNNQKFARQGDVLPGFATNLQAGSQAPIYLANSGDLFWHARVLNADSFMRNLQVIVQAQNTVVGGLLVTSVSGAENAFHASRDGRFWVGLVQLQGVGDALLAADFGLVVPVPGCAGNPGVLSKVGGDARPGAQLNLEMDVGQASGVTPVLFFCTSPAVPGSPCGMLSPHGEVLMDITTEVATRVGPAWTGTPSSFAIDLPARMSLVGLEFFSQGVFWDIAGTTGAPRLQLTNGLRLQIGAL